MEVLVKPEIFISSRKEEAVRLLVELLNISAKTTIFWNNNFYHSLYGNDDSIFMDKNFINLISYIQRNFEPVEMLEIPAKQAPISEILDEFLNSSFLKMVHTLIHDKKKELLICGNEDLVFSCSCCKVVLKAFSFITLEDILDKNIENICEEFWPKTKEEFHSNFLILIDLFFRYNKKVSIYKVSDIRFSNDFISSFIDLPRLYRYACITDIITRLSMSRDKASRSTSLKDEPIMGRKKNEYLRRFRVSKNSLWIHYSMSNHKIFRFEALNLQHDKGL